MAISFKKSKPAMAFGRRVSVPGCDDAPVVSVTMAADYKHVTLIYPYYENPLMLKRQLEHWRSLPVSYRERLSAIIVDDGSPDTPAVQVLADEAMPFPVKLFRIEVDVRWNWIAARNLAMSKASGWCILTDIDHMVPEGTIYACLHGDHDPDTIYRFMRKEHTGETIHPHPNSWLMTTDMFWRIGGYDEAFSGHYGTDGEYRRRCVEAAPVRIMCNHLVRYEHVGDSSTVRYLRKQPEDAAVGRIIAARGPDWKPKTLTFAYHEVAL